MGAAEARRSRRSQGAETRPGLVASRMRSGFRSAIRAGLCLATASLLGGSILAQSTDQDTPTLDQAQPPSYIPPQAVPEPEAQRRQELDILFGRLRQASDAEARPIEAAIRAALADAGSPTVDLLMARGETLLKAGSLDEAMSLYAVITEIRPEFAAGWSRRGTVHFLRGQFSAARDDFRRALALEPRDFDALRDLGAVLEQAGDRKGALDAYRQALVLNPHLQGLGQRVQWLEETIRGRGL